jgi:hypothetical protein
MVGGFTPPSCVLARFVFAPFGAEIGLQEAQNAARMALTIY